ncbi:metacaspase-1 [Ephemerocybe angulata]|uniref:Metacaspase-1 n=1 Tax=Ephemerocybe angulata TaxID=980116 RepID=A0A8H6HX83_9AGAR|nr:metacaspase-1 [Tulosesus angulatus]
MPLFGSTPQASQGLRIDLSSQRLLIDPDDPLPRFNPRPKAVMVIPIYHDSEITQYPRMVDQRKKTAFLNPSIGQHSSSSHKRPSALRRASSYSPPRHKSKSKSRHHRDHSVPPRTSTYDPRYPPPIVTSGPSRGRSNSRHHPNGFGSPTSQSWYSPQDQQPYALDRGDRARPSSDPLAQNPPNYQLQATQGHNRYNPPTGSYHTGVGSHGAVPMDRERPSNDPLAQSVPDYQAQATQLHGGAGAPPMGQAHSAQGYGQMPGAYAGHPSSAGAVSGSVYQGQHLQGQPHYAGHATSTNIGGGSPYPPHQQHSTLGQAVIPLINGLSHGSSHGQAIDEALANYYKILPPNPKWCQSRCGGNKKAVCIGINYLGMRDELKGCANDARGARDFIIRNYGFHPSNVLLLTDDDRHNIMPTRKEIFKAFMWLVNGAKKDDSLFFHYSGHGGQSQDASGREKDDMDETIYPVDFEKAGDIIDDELYQALVQPLPPGCRLTAIFDSCHSGTVLDLPYVHSAHGRLRGVKHVSRRAVGRGVAPAADVICWSACKDDETSADTFKGGVAVGAMSHALIQTLTTNLHQTYDELLAHLRELLIPQYHQKAQISCSHPLDLSQRFTL